jgi:hypothetical protein
MSPTAWAESGWGNFTRINAVLQTDLPQAAFEGGTRGKKIPDLKFKRSKNRRMGGFNKIDNQDIFWLQMWA